MEISWNAALCSNSALKSRQPFKDSCFLRVEILVNEFTGQPGRGKKKKSDGEREERKREIILSQFFLLLSLQNSLSRTCDLLPPVFNGTLSVFLQPFSAFFLSSFSIFFVSSKLFFRKSRNFGSALVCAKLLFPRQQQRRGRQPRDLKMIGKFGKSSSQNRGRQIFARLFSIQRLCT